MAGSGLFLDNRKTRPNVDASLLPRMREEMLADVNMNPNNDHIRIRMFLKAQCCQKSSNIWRIVGSQVNPGKVRDPGCELIQRETCLMASL